MPKYGRYNPLISPAPITGWYDTDEHDYGDTLPPLDQLFLMTEDQWKVRMTGFWAVINKSLQAQAYTVPPTFMQTAQIALAAGLTVTTSGSIALDAVVFPVDPSTQIKLAAIITTISATGGFPGGLTAYPMKDAAGAWHSFTIGQYTAVASAIAAYASGLELIIDGNPLNAVVLPTPHVSLINI